ncbi:MAG: PA2778 family cysteine peptidase, partial [Ectothiorhodospiraceae bacterium]|nr:PA2778 family cysteine peptidase [Ectothiorhodospiraceae bacterium]
MPLLLAACASAPLQYQQLEEDERVSSSGKVELTDVPFFPQEEYHCGPAALATVMNWLGEEVHPDDLAPRVYLNSRRGSLQAEMLAATRRQGLLPYVHEPRFATIIEQLDAGQPVLILQNLAFDRFPVWHYAVAVGYDREAGEVVLRSGTTEREVLSFRRFERTWQGGGYWAVTVHEPHELPAHASEHRYLSAAAGLEQVGELEAAGRADHTAPSAGPGRRGAGVGRGHGSDRRGHYAAAAG